MSKSDDHKGPYLDISYGWQNREEITRLRGRRRRYGWLVLAGFFIVPLLVYSFWRLS